MVDVQGERIAWREATPVAPDWELDTLVLLHGLGGSRVSWGPQLAALGTVARVVAWDLPGYGASPPLEVPMTFAALADAVAGLCDELSVDRVHLAGISFGGMIAQYVAALHPSRLSTLTLLATSPKFGLDGTGAAEWRQARLAPLDAGEQPADFAAAVLAGLVATELPPEAMAAQREGMSRITAPALRRAIECLLTHDSRMLLPSLTTPTVCMVGERDEETPVAYARAVVDLIPGARLVVVPGAGHLLHVEAPAAVNEVLGAQLARSSA